MRALLVAFLLVLAMGPRLWAADDGEQGKPPFQSRAAVMPAVDAVLDKARAENKLALIALGANWCHDSRGLVSKLDVSAIKAVVDAHYVPLLVNVGYYDEGIEVAHRFGRPTIFSTPTVLIIDPATERQVNTDTMHRWSGAAAMDNDEAAGFLLAVAEQAGLNQSTLSAPQKQALARIADFEADVSKRIERGFSVVGPILKARMAGEEVDLDAVWDPLAGLRYKLMRDVTQMRKTVRAHRGDSPIAFDFPTYAALPWERGEEAGEEVGDEGE